MANMCCSSNGRSRSAPCLAPIRGGGLRRRRVFLLLRARRGRALFRFMRCPRCSQSQPPSTTSSALPCARDSRYVAPVSHFAAIGLRGETPEAMQESVGQAFDQGVAPPELGEQKEGHVWFNDTSGAALAIHLNTAGEVECITPFFAGAGGGTRWRVRSSAPHVDRDCEHCSGADCDILDREQGETTTRATVQWLFFEPYRDWLAERREYDLEVVGFASMLAVGETKDDLEPVQARLFGERDPVQPVEPGKPLRLAETAFLPYGMFENDGDVGQRARALVTGSVVKMETPTNALTGRRFVQLRLRTLGGDLNVVAPDGTVEGLLTGKVALADVWLVGRPAEPPPPARASGKGAWLSKLIGRN